MSIMRLPQPGGAINIGAELRVLVQDKDGVDFSMIFFPDVNNDLLRQAGLPMHFYYVPQSVHLAKDFINGQKQFKFHLQEFAGVLTKDGNVGTPKDLELAGGYLTFSTTLATDESVMAKIRASLQADLQARYSRSKLLGWNSTLPPVVLGPVQITQAMTVVHKINMDNLPETDGPPMGAYVVQGEGEANLTPTGTNAYSVMLGSIPVQMVKAAALSGDSNIVVENHIKYKIHTQPFTLKITGSWQSIFEHLSVAFKGRAWFASADVAAEWNNMRKSGVIQVDMTIDGEFINPDKEKQLEEYKEAIVKMFMEAAQKAILEPAPPQVEPAKAEDRGGWLWSASGALKFRKDRSTLDLVYDEKRQLTVLRSTKISATMQGLASEIKKDPAREKLYFSIVPLDEGFQKVHVVASCNANWGENGSDGDPIKRIDLQVGYPDSKGNIVWKASGKFKENNAETDLSANAAPAFWDKDTQDRLYIFDFMKQKSLPADKQNKIFIKKNIRFSERPNVLVNTTSIQEVTEDRIVEVRGESAGKFGVKISLDDAPLPPKMKVIVTCKTKGLPDEVFEFNEKNTEDGSPTYNWEIFYAKPEDIRDWQYRVDVSLGGPTVLSKRLKWSTGLLQGPSRGRNVVLNVGLPEVPEDLMPKVMEYLGIEEEA